MITLILITLAAVIIVAILQLVIEKIIGPPVLLVLGIVDQEIRIMWLWSCTAQGRRARENRITFRYFRAATIVYEHQQGQRTRRHQ